MTFRTLSFSSLFHDAFRLAPQNFIEHLLLDNEIRPYAESALLKILLYEHLRDELPELSANEPNIFWERMRYRMGYPEENRTMEFLKGIDISLVELTEAIKMHLRIDKFVDQFINTLLSNESNRNAVLWELLLNLSLRERIVRVAGREYLSSNKGEELDENMRAAVRSHLMLKHDIAPWPHLVNKLVQCWGMTEGKIEQLVNILAKAHLRLRKGYADVQSKKS